LLNDGKKMPRSSAPGSDSLGPVRLPTKAISSSGEADGAYMWQYASKKDGSFGAGDRLLLAAHQAEREDARHRHDDGCRILLYACTPIGIQVFRSDRPALRRHHGPSKKR